MTRRAVLLIVVGLLLAQPAAAQNSLVKMASLWNGGNSGNAFSVTGATNTTAVDSPSYLYTSTDWDPVPTIYFEVSLAMTAGGGTAFARLFNFTDTAAVTDGEVSTTSATAVRLRSSALTLTTAKEYKVQIRGSIAGVTARLTGARLIFVQNGTIIKTETIYEMYGEDTTTGTSYTEMVDGPRYYHDTAFLDGTVAYYFEANLSPSNAASTASVELYDVTGAATVGSSEVTHTGNTTNTRKRSAAITLSTTNTYVARLKTDTNTARLRGARIIILQTASPTKTVSFYPLKPWLQTATSAGATRDANILWDADEWNVASYAVYFVCWAAASTGDTASCILELVDGTNIDTQTTTSTTQTRLVSGSLSLTDGTEYNVELDNSDGSSSSFFGQSLRIEATLNAGTGGARRFLTLGVGDQP